MTADERNDSIFVGAVSPLTFDALKKFAEKNDWPEVTAYMEPADMLLFIERLKHTDDEDDVFPRGKWATIQALQTIFDKGMWK